MLTQLISSVTSALSAAGVPEVYSSFDSVPVERKSSGIFTVVGMGKFESSTPIYSAITIYLPFKAEVEVKVTAPEKWSMEKLCDFYSAKIEPVLLAMTGLTASVSDISIKHDSNISRLVLSVKLRVSGITRIERGVE